MKPKEKAIELRDKFIPSTKVFYNDDWKTDLTEAKKCALITVNEILDLGYDSKGSSFRVYKFYSDVKLELEKL